MKTYSLLEKKCAGCAEGAHYTARFYNEAVDKNTCYRQLPPYAGACLISVSGIRCHITAMSMHDGEFEDKHQLDLFLRLLEEEPQLVTASYERHKPYGVEVKRTIDIVKRILFLTRG